MPVFRGGDWQRGVDVCKSKKDLQETIGRFNCCFYARQQIKKAKVLFQLTHNSAEFSVAESRGQKSHTLVDFFFFIRLREMNEG